MRGFGFLVFVFLSVISGSASEAAGESYLIETKVEPACVSTEFNQQRESAESQVSRSAVQVKNKCASVVVINGFEITPIQPAEETKPVLHAHILIKGDKYRYAIFAAPEENCAPEKIEASLFAEDERQAKAKYNRTRKKFKQMGLEMKQPLEEHLKIYRGPASQKRIGNREIVCGQVAVYPGETLGVGVEYEHAYALWGFLAGADGRTPVRVQGKTINPFVPTPTTLALAERGDRALRYDLVRALLASENEEEQKRGWAWLLAAAEEDYSLSRHLLATYYNDGIGTVKKDLETAYFWWLLAGEKHKGLSRYLDEAEKQLTPAQIAKVKSRVEDWKKTHPKPEPVTPAPR